MRVIAGKFGGQLFDSPNGHRTHPMSEKMRGALFGALGDIVGLRILDAFAGSSALGIEAVSRGAEFVQAIEVDPRAFAVSKNNIEKFGIEDTLHITKAYAGAWSTRHQNELFDVVLLDPPYDNIPYRDLKRMPRHMKKDGILVLSWPAKIDYFYFEGLEMIQSKDYGDGSLYYYKIELEAKK